MAHDELSTLCDVYQTLRPDFRQKQATDFVARFNIRRKLHVDNAHTY